MIIPDLKGMLTMACRSRKDSGVSTKHKPLTVFLSRQYPSCCKTEMSDFFEFLWYDSSLRKVNSAFFSF